MATVNEKMTLLADKLRQKSGVSGLLSIEGMVAAADKIPFMYIDGEPVRGEVHLVSTKINAPMGALPGDFTGGTLIEYNEQLCAVGVAGAVYTWDGNAWALLTTHPAGDGRLAAVLDGSLYFIGGPDVYNHLYRLDGTNWTDLGTETFSDKSMNSMNSLVAYNGQLHYFCYGYSGGSYQSIHKIWTGSAWADSTVPEPGSYDAEVAVFDGKIHLLYNVTSMGLTHWRHYAWDGTTWEQLSSLPMFTTNDAEALEYAGELHLLNGSSHYKWDGAAWTRLPDLPYTFTDGAAAVFGGKIHIAGGTDNALSHYILDKEYYTATSIDTPDAPDAPDIPAGDEGTVPSEGLNIVYSDNYGGQILVSRGTCTDSVIVIPEGVVGFEYNAFQNDAQVTKVYAPESITVWGSYAFIDCPNLTEIYIPGVISISSFELCGLSGLQYVKFGPNIQDIGGGTFVGSTGATYDFSDALAVPYFDAYNGSELGTNPTIIVPSNLLDGWKSATNWSMYADYIVAAE